MNFHKRAKFTDKAITVSFYIVAMFFLSLLAAMTIYIIAKGVISFDPKYIGFDRDGLGVQLFNTLYIVILTLLISTPLGICAGIYMAEYAKEGRLTNIIRTCIETLSSLPSIVVGLFGFLVFVVMTHSSWNMIAGVLSLSILCIPLLTRTTEDGIREIDDTYREASYALGTTQWQTIGHVLVPSAIPRIVTGVILAAGRCFGEAAALIYTAGMSSDINFNNWDPTSHRSPLSLFRAADTLAVRIWDLKTAAIMPDKDKIADMAAALLIILVFAFNLGARFIGRSLERKKFGKSR
jgi:phosphate transport system permease protein